jgi:mycothiol synthase
MSTSNPPHFSIRPATWDDLEATVAFLNDTDEHDIGKRNFSPEGLAVDWKKPGFLENSTRLVSNKNGSMVGYAEAYHRSHPPVKTIVFGRTHPAFRGLGIGTSFLQWGEAFAQADFDKCPASARIYLSTLTADTIEPAKTLFEDFGMHPVRAYLRMQTELSNWDHAPKFPASLKIQPYRHDQDLIPLHYAFEKAFAHNWGYTSQSEQAGTAKIRGWIENDDNFDASLWLLAWDGQEVAGFILAASGQGAHEAKSEVYELGVQPHWQKRGLGKALLHQTFHEMKRRGKESVFLDVDADPVAGALKFYVKAGMSVLTRRLMYEKTLREGENNED